MKTKEEAVNEAFSALTLKGSKDLLGVLEELWDEAVERAYFEREMATISYHIVQAIEKKGPEVVADRMGITVEELTKRVTPAAVGELRMSELRLLSLCAEVSMSFTVVERVPFDPKTEE